MSSCKATGLWRLFVWPVRCGDAGALSPGGLLVLTLPQAGSPGFPGLLVRPLAWQACARCDLGHRAVLAGMTCRLGQCAAGCRAVGGRFDELVRTLGVRRSLALDWLYGPGVSGLAWWPGSTPMWP